MISTSKENLYMAQGFKELAEGFSSAIDGEIPYNDIKLQVGKTLYISEEFFGNIDVVTKDHIGMGILKINAKLDHINILERYLQDTNFKSPAARELYTASLREYRDKFLMFRKAIWIEAEKGGFKLDVVKKSRIQDEVEKFHKEIWGDPKFDSVSEELNFRRPRVQASYNEVKTAFENKKGLLTKEDRHLVKFLLKMH